MSRSDGQPVIRPEIQASIQAEPLADFQKARILLFIIVYHLINYLSSLMDVIVDSHCSLYCTLSLCRNGTKRK